MPKKSLVKSVKSVQVTKPRQYRMFSGRQFLVFAGNPKFKKESVFAVVVNEDNQKFGILTVNDEGHPTVWDIAPSEVALKYSQLPLIRMVL